MTITLSDPPLFADVNGQMVMTINDAGEKLSALRLALNIQTMMPQTTWPQAKRAGSELFELLNN